MNRIRKTVKVQKSFTKDMDVVTVSRSLYKKHYITVHPENGTEPFNMFDKAFRFLKENNAIVLLQNIFGPCSMYREGMNNLASLFGDVSWPVTWLEGDTLPMNALTGAQLHAVSNTSIEPVVLDNHVVGNVFEDENARYCYLADIKSLHTSISRRDQAMETFEKMERGLQTIGMDFSNVVRTWLYLNKILEWYDDFNKVRTEFFNSRAVEIEFPDHRRLYVSGTASIKPTGETAFVGDTEKQVALTMEVVFEILKSRNMDWSDLVRADALKV